MPNVCQTCKREDVDQIDALLIKRVAFRNIMELFPKLSLGSLSRHNKECLVFPHSKALEKKRSGLLAEVDAIREKISVLDETFADSGMVRVGLVGKRIDVLDREAKLTGAYQQDRPNDLAVELKAQLAALIEDHGREQAMEIFRMFQAKSLADGVGEEVLRLVEGEDK